MDDCVAGMQTTATKEKYIQYAGSAERSADEIARYSSYVSRSVFYNYILRTISALVGLATADKLMFEVGSRLEYAENNIDGKGTTLLQSVKRTTGRVIAHGRYGVLVDHPATDSAVTQAQVDDGIFTATAVGYDAAQIINWGYQKRGGAMVLSLVVLEENILERGEDGFSMEQVAQYRVLSLIDNVYTMTVYNENGEYKEPPINPRISSGQTINFIPFQFFGVSDNDADIDKSIMYDMSVINVGHLQNSADYENSLWLCGQPQPWASGLTEHWVNDVLGETVLLGSGSFLPLPEGASFGIAQTEPNSQAFEAMGHKEKQMVAMGAKMISAEGSFDSATEAAINNQGEASFLDSVIDNVTDGYQQVVEWLAAFMGETQYEYANPVDLSVYVTNPQLVQQVRESWLAGMISRADAQDFMRKHSLIERTNEEMDDLLDNEPVSLELNA